MEKLTGARKSAYHITGPAVRLMAKTGVTPDNLSWIGFAIAVGAAVLIGTGHIFIAGFVVLAGGFFDMLDGALARYTGKVTSSGAVLDSLLDRVSEALLLLGVLFYYVFWGGWSGLGIVLVGLAMVASPLPSYIRAKAEASGLDCKIGLFTRPERVIVLAVGLLASYVSNSLYIALAIIAVFSFVTAGQRWLYVQKRLANRCGDGG
ncbi:MAG: CDP-alcohol phosphatidyltransferase family protein [Dehalococcoidales bacterium]